MGYLGNHLATVVTGAFAAVLTALWPIFIGFAPVLDFVFVMAVPITWFLAFTCWIAQKSSDYMHAHSSNHRVAAAIEAHGGQKGLADSSQGIIVAENNNLPGLQKVQSELSADLDELQKSLKLKDSEIERLNQQIANLRTLVQIETLKAELANLKMLASKRK